MTQAGEAEGNTTLADELRRRLGSGVRLGGEERRSFEGQLGADLSGVMVHRGPTAAGVAKALGADALTVGQHVLGGATALDASTRGGAALLGHEAAHTVQRALDPAQAEEEAQRIEAIIRGQTQRGGTPRIDARVVADRVYQRLLDTLTAERERSGWTV